MILKPLNERQERILLSLKKLDYLDRDQLQRIHKLGKVRNTNRILRDLSPYLSSFRNEYSTIYYLNSLGREYVNSQKVRRKNQFVSHVLMRNQFYIYAKCPLDWENEMLLKDNNHSVICDTLFKLRKINYCLEVDLTQKMKENRAKINQYIGLYKGGAIEQHFEYFPTIVWLTTTELRRKKLAELCKELPNVMIYTLSDIM